MSAMDGKRLAFAVLFVACGNSGSTPDASTGDASTNDVVQSADGSDASQNACGSVASFIPSWITSATFTKEVYVDPNGNDTNDGSSGAPFKTPAKEDDPRHMPPNFYYDQQDFLESRQKGKRWSWSAVRPHAVCGFSTGGPMNLTLAIAVYANISKALGLPLSFPGKPGAYTVLYQATDAALLAKAMVWMATDPKCANQAFNITNGDLIRWQHLWPKFADFFGMELAPPRHISLSRTMADKGPIWDRIVADHRLKPHAYEDIVGWGYPENVFNSDYDIVSATSKARRFGFHDLVDTEEMFMRMFGEFRSNRIIP